jgi:hypothetical protein
LTATEAQHVLITTDGDDNSSTYSIKTLNKLIERAEQAGWTFTFIGCTKEAYKQGTQFKMSSQPIDLTDPTSGFSQSTEPYLDGTPPQNPSLFMAMGCVSDNTVRLNKQYTNSVSSAQATASTLYAIARQSGTSVIDLLQTFQGLDSMKVSLTMAYYLNSLNPTKSIMFGINSILIPNSTIQRNIIQ